MSVRPVFRNRVVGLKHVAARDLVPHPGNWRTQLLDGGLPLLMVTDPPYGVKYDPSWPPEADEPAPEDRTAEEAWYAVRKGATADWRGGRKQTTVWEIGFQGEVKTEHGTQKPVECMARPIRNHGGAGDAVYEPFCGSGSTLIAAEQCGRRCYAMELNPVYCDVIVRRWEAFTGGKAERIRCLESSRKEVATKTSNLSSPRSTRSKSSTRKSEPSRKRSKANSPA